MARKRVNVQFLAAAVLVLCVLGAGSFLAYRKFHHKNPKPFIDKAHELVAAGNYKDAVDQYRIALGLQRPPDPALWVEYGDTLAHLGTADPDRTVQAPACYNEALTINPSYQPALVRLMKTANDMADLTGRPERFAELRKAADKVLAVDKNDKEAIHLRAKASVLAALQDLENNPSYVDQAEASLTKLHQDDPTNAEDAYLLAVTHVVRARWATTASDKKEADQQLDQAWASMSESLKGQENNPAMLQRAAMLRGMLVHGGKEEVVKIITEMSDFFKRARAAVKDDDPALPDIYIMSANVQERALGDFSGAEATLRELLKRRPDDANATLALARFLGKNPMKQKEALKLVSEPLKSDPTLLGYKAVVLGAGSEMSRLSVLADLKLDSLPQDADARNKQLAEIDEIAGKMSAINKRNDTPELLLIRGRVQVARDQKVEAIQTLARALSMMPSNPLDERRNELMFVLARAYADAGQTGDARKLLGQILAVPNPSQVQLAFNARVMMIQLLLQENDRVEARKQFDALEQLLKPLPTPLLRLGIAVSDPVREQDRINTYYAGLPETNPTEQLEKLRAAMALSRTPEVERIGNALMTANPKDETPYVVLASYDARTDKAKAAAIVDQGLAQFPDSRNLKILKAQISGSEQQMHETVSSMIDQIKDPFQREMALYQRDYLAHDTESAVKHLFAAEKIKPDDGTAMEAIFNYYLDQKDWAKAGEYLDRATKANADLAGGALYRIRWEMKQGHNAAALEQAQIVVTRLPEFGQSWSYMAQIQQALGRYDDAIGNFNTALQKSPGNVEAIQGIAQCYYSLNQPDQAKRVLLEALSHNPSSPLLNEMGMQHELQYGDPSNVIPPREAELASDRDNVIPWRKLGVAYLFAGLDARKKDKPDVAEQYFAKARAHYSEAIKKFPDDAMVLRGYTDSCIASNHFDDAERAVTAFTSRPSMKDTVDAYTYQSAFCVRAGKPDKAEQALRAGIATLGPKPELQLPLADMLQQNGQFDAAIAVLNDNPDDPRVVRRKVEAMIDAGRSADAEQVLQKALAKNADSEDLQVLDGLVKLNTGKYDNGMKTLGAVLEKSPNNPYALFYRGRAQLQNPQGDVTMAVHDLSEVRDVDSDNLVVRMLLAEALARRNDMAGSAHELEGAMRIAPNDLGIRLKLLATYSRSNPPRWVDAERLIADTKTNADLAKAPELALAEANMYITRQDPDRAIPLLRQGLAQSPNSTPLAQALFEALLSKKDYGALAAETDRAIKAHPDQWWIHEVRARAAARQHDTATAVAEYNATIKAVSSLQTINQSSVPRAITASMARELGPDAALKIADAYVSQNPAWQLAAAQLCRDARRPDEALTRAQPLAQPGAPGVTPALADDAINFLGETYMTVDPPQYQKALEMYLKIVDRRQNDWNFLNNLAYIYTMPGPSFKPEQAVKYSEQAFKLLQDRGQYQPQVSDTYAWSLIQANRVDEGINLLNDTLGKAEMPVGFYHLGQAYTQKKRFDDAEKQYTKALNLLTQMERDTPLKPEDAALKRDVQQALAKAQQVNQPQ